MSNIEELEPFEEVENEQNISELEGKYQSILSPSYNLFKTSIFPVLIINKNLKIIYANEICENLFSGFTNLAGKYFFDLFGKAFNLDDSKKIKETIINGRNGFSWKGSAHLKKRNTASLQVMVYIFPLEMDLKAPSDFVVMFDDFSHENKKILRSTFFSLLEASKLKDNDTGKHTVRVNEYSKLLANEFLKTAGSSFKSIDNDFIDNIGFLAAMHDIGKIGTPDDILNKESSFVDWEWTIMREHTKNGAFILSTYPNPMAKEIALSHHEKWNGTGYPFKLEGEMIPLSARIVTIADVYDALRMERSYRPALNHDISCQKIIEGSGTHFAPQLVEVFKNIAGDFKAIYDKYAD